MDALALVHHYNYRYNQNQNAVSKKVSALETFRVLNITDWFSNNEFFENYLEHYLNLKDLFI